MKINITIEEDCYCDNGIVLELNFDGSLCTYICMDCNGSGKIYVKKDVTIEEFKEITGAKVDRV